METILLFIYSNTFATILVCIAVGFIIALFVLKFTKTNNIYPSVFAFSLLTYGVILFSPIPSPVEVQIIQMLDLLEQNKVESHRTINAVLIPCMSKDYNGVRGMHVNQIRDDFRTDMDEHIDQVGSFTASIKELKLKTDDLCEAAWVYNQLKLNRVEKLETKR